MSTILMALSFGAISMIVVFLSGMASGVVRVWTLMLRCGLAFCLTSAACYFLLIMLEMYYQRLHKEEEQVASELAEETAEEGEENFQPTEADEVPRTNV